MKIRSRSKGTVPTQTGRARTDRRGFLKAAATALGAGAVAGTPAGFVRRARAGEKNPFPDAKQVKTVCTHCSVGCGVIAEVQNGVWVRQEMELNHPISRGALCCKGASLRDFAMSDKRLRHPIKLVGGKWQKISWEKALDEIADRLLQIRKESGPDSVFWMGSAKMSNEQCYLFRKMAAMWGTNNVDHQARV